MSATISSLTVIDAAPYKNGDRLLARFDIQIRGFLIKDCLLLRASRGFLLAQTPKSESKQGDVRVVQVIEKELRVEMANAAHGMYALMGGQENIVI